MKKYRILSAALAAVMLLGMLAGCGGGDSGSPDVTTTAAAETETAESTVQRHKLPDTDWEGREFMVLGRTDSAHSQFTNFEIYAEELTGELVNDAVFNRNLEISTKYNADLAQNLVVNPADTAQKQILAGDDFAKMMFVQIQQAGGMATKGYYVNYDRLEYIDLSAPWWSQEITDKLSLGGKIYFTTSYFNLMDKNRTYSMVFSKDLMKDFNLGDLYQTVRDGRWTIDLMTEYCRTVAADLNGNGEMDIDDRIGYGTDSYNAFYVNWIGCGNVMCVKDSDGYPVIDVLNDRSMLSADKLLDLYNDRSVVMIPDEWKGKVTYDHWYTSSYTFYDNRALFKTNFSHGFAHLSEKTEIDYGCVPNPKLDESQEVYLSALDPVGAMLMAVPMTNVEYDFTGFMMELLSERGLYDIMPVYYETTLKTKYTYDVESGEMLDLIFANLTTDLAIVFNWKSCSQWFTLILPKDKTNSLPTLWASNESALTAAISETMDAIDALD